MEILVIRHGETEANAKNHYYGFTDSPLTENGINQAKMAGEAVKVLEFSPDEIFISERFRTWLTLENMGFDKNDAIIDKRINEQHFGAFENMSYEEIGRNFPDIFDAFNRDFFNFKIPQGESRKETYERVKDFFEELKEKYKETDKKILVVCHGGVMSSFYTYLIGGNFLEAYSAFFGNCAMLRVKYMSGKLVIQSLYAAPDYIKFINSRK